MALVGYCLHTLIYSTLSLSPTFRCQANHWGKKGDRDRHKHVCKAAQKGELSVSPSVATSTCSSAGAARKQAAVDEAAAAAAAGTSSLMSITSNLMSKLAVEGEFVQVDMQTNHALADGMIFAKYSTQHEGANTMSPGFHRTMMSRAPSIAATETARRVASGDMLHDAAFGFCHLSRVKVKGLAKKKELNGVHGTISCAGTGQAMPGPHRWNVELDAPHSKIVRIKGQNLSPIEPTHFCPVCLENPETAYNVATGGNSSLCGVCGTQVCGSCYFECLRTNPTALMQCVICKSDRVKDYQVGIGRLKALLVSHPHGRFIPKVHMQLGHVYEAGMGTAVDGVKAELHWLIASQGGLAQAQFNLGNNWLMKGMFAKDVPLQYKGVQWITRAIEQDYPPATSIGKIPHFDETTDIGRIVRDVEVHGTIQMDDLVQ